MNQQNFRFESWGLSDAGRVRELNEDRFLMQPELGLWVVADGMGGHAAGEVASDQIVTSLATLGVSSSASDQQARFVDRLARANRQMREYSASHNGMTMGATVAALLTYQSQFCCFWMGDSRVYQVRRGVLTQISHDHSEVQELVDKGTLTRDEARTWPRRNVITRAVGAREHLDVEAVGGTVEVGDTYLLCSDGLTSHVTDNDILAALQGKSPREACEHLVQLALEGGGTDNVTVVVFRCRDLEATRPPEPFPATEIQTADT